jgi:CRISPR-associated protein Cmr4
MEYFVEGLPPVIQLGGNSTIGKGIVRTRIMDL